MTGGVGIASPVVRVSPRRGAGLVVLRSARPLTAHGIYVSFTAYSKKPLIHRVNNAGATRAVRNIGTTRINLVEVELK